MRKFDIVLAVLGLFVLLIPMLLISLLIKLSSRGPVLYWSDRVGRGGVTFRMPKFRSMKINTPAVATHLLGNPKLHLTPMGSFLRRSSLDELPQLWSILIGEMSFVGPRPALFNQYDLIEKRAQLGIDALRPGLTGLAQISGRDEIPVDQKVALDFEYLQRLSLALNVEILLRTFSKVLAAKGISH